MKNKLNEIFDEAKPQELDQFSNELTAPALPDEVLASVKSKVFAKTNLKKENKNTKSVWLRIGAVAACLALILGAMIVVPMLRDDSPDIEPYFPDGTAWDPTIAPSINEVILTADEIAGVFDVAEYEITGFEQTAAAENLRQVHYVIRTEVSCAENSDLAGSFHITSTWQKTDGEWKLIFNMDSRILS